VTKYKPSGEIMSIYEAAMQLTSTNAADRLAGSGIRHRQIGAIGPPKGTACRPFSAACCQSSRASIAPNLVAWVLQYKFRKWTTLKPLKPDGTETTTCSVWAGLKPRRT